MLYIGIVKIVLVDSGRSNGMVFLKEEHMKYCNWMQSTLWLQAEMKNRATYHIVTKIYRMLAHGMKYP